MKTLRSLLKGLMADLLARADLRQPELASNNNGLLPAPPPNNAVGSVTETIFFFCFARCHVIRDCQGQGPAGFFVWRVACVSHPGGSCETAPRAHTSRPNASAASIARRPPPSASPQSAHCAPSWTALARAAS